MITPSSTVPDRLADEIRRNAARSERPFVVAIDGRSGAGKSTLAEILAKRLDALVISGDDFFAGGVTPRDDPPSILTDICIDWRALGEVVRTLLASGEARFRPFDWDAFDGSRHNNPVVLTARPVIIVEGVYAARPELRALIDFSVLIECPDALRLQRLIDREGEIGAWERQWHRAEDWYFKTKAHREGFDAILVADDWGSTTLVRRPG